jgi:hypothetical protein
MATAWHAAQGVCNWPAALVRHEPKGLCSYGVTVTEFNFECVATTTFTNKVILSFLLFVVFVCLR